MGFLKYILIGAFLLSGPAYALDSSDLIAQEKDNAKQQEKAENHTNKDIKAESKKAEKSKKVSPHKNIYQKHISRRPYKENLSH